MDKYLSEQIEFQTILIILETISRKTLQDQTNLRKYCGILKRRTKLVLSGKNAVPVKYLKPPQKLTFSCIHYIFLNHFS